MSLHVLDDAPTTDDAFGTAPDDRSLEQRLALASFSSTSQRAPLASTCAWARDMLVRTPGPRWNTGPLCNRRASPHDRALHENHQ